MNASIPSLVRGASALGFCTLAACGVLGGGASSQSMLYDGTVQFPAVLHRSSLRVVAIDGKSNTFRTPLIDPGRHEVRFAARPVGQLTQSVEKIYTLEIAPCTRYYPVAQRDAALSQDWHLVIERIEPLGGACSVSGGATKSEAESKGVGTDVVLDAGRPYP